MTVLSKRSQIQAVVFVIFNRDVQTTTGNVRLEKTSRNAEMYDWITISFMKAA